jgi:hypothetical protein
METTRIHKLRHTTPKASNSTTHWQFAAGCPKIIKSEWLKPKKVYQTSDPGWILKDYLAENIIPMPWVGAA